VEPADQAQQAQMAAVAAAAGMLIIIMCRRRETAAIAAAAAVGRGRLIATQPRTRIAVALVEMALLDHRICTRLALTPHTLDARAGKAAAAAAVVVGQIRREGERGVMGEMARQARGGWQCCLQAAAMGLVEQGRLGVMEPLDRVEPRDQAALAALAATAAVRLG
jgi:hypothetical protein